MLPIDELDAAKGGPFRIRHKGEIYRAVDPSEIPGSHVVWILQYGLPDTPNMPLFKREALLPRWRAHYDLPTFQQAQRLVYVVNRYRDDLEHDLRVFANTDLGELWRSRRWRTLLVLIDRLPGHSHYSEAVSKDEEHSKMLADAMAAAPKSDGPTGPPLHTWTPEVALLTQLVDAVRHLEHTVVAVQVPKGKAGNPPEPSPRPVNLLGAATKRAEYDRRQEVHNKLAARLLPHKAPK